MSACVAGMVRRRSGLPPGTYVLPKGGPFEWVACPHYTAEIISYVGLALPCLLQPASPVHAASILAVSTWVDIDVHVGGPADTNTHVDEARHAYPLRRCSGSSSATCRCPRWGTWRGTEPSFRRRRTGKPCSLSCTRRVRSLSQPLRLNIFDYCAAKTRSLQRRRPKRVRHYCQPPRPRCAIVVKKSWASVHLGGVPHPQVHVVDGSHRVLGQRDCKRPQVLPQLLHGRRPCAKRGQKGHLTVLVGARAGNSLSFDKHCM